MGGVVAKPSPPADNVAKANNDISMEALQLSSEAFLNNIRLGTASSDVLGYKLTDQKLTSQESHIICQTTANAPNDEIKKAVDDIFSGDWKGVTEIVAGSLASFFGSPAPSANESAVNDKYSKSYLKWEHDNVVQYSFLVRRTNASSVGTLAKDTQATMMSVICRGIVDFTAIDPQAVVYALKESTGDDIAMEDLQKIFERVKLELSWAADLAKFKKGLMAGVTDVPGGPHLNSFAIVGAPAEGDDDATSSLPEVARLQAINSGIRAKVRNSTKAPVNESIPSPINVVINGTLVEAEGIREVALNVPGAHNVVTVQGAEYVAKTLIEIGSGDQLELVSCATDGATQFQLKCGDKSVVEFTHQ